MAKKNILLVDDEKNILAALSHILRAENYNVIRALNGLDAWFIIESAKYIDLLITDLEMGTMNGMELVEKLGSSPHKFPVLIITGHRTEEAVSRLKRAGVTEIMDKPFNTADIVGRVKTIFTRGDGDEQ